MSNLKDSRDLEKDIKLPYVIEKKILMSPGVWNRTYYSPQEVEKGFQNTDWGDKTLRALFWDHADKNSRDWIGEIKNQRMDGPNVVGDLVIVDKPAAMKLAFGAKFGISPKVFGEEDEQMKISDFVFKNFSVVIDPAVKTAYINNSQITNEPADDKEKREVWFSLNELILQKQVSKFDFTHINYETVEKLMSKTKNADEALYNWSPASWDVAKNVNKELGVHGEEIKKKKLQISYQTSTDQGHSHLAILDKEGNGGTSKINNHTHKVIGFKVQEANGHIHTIKRGSKKELADELAVWSTAFVNALPDSAFFYVKTIEGKKIRKLPYKDSTGKVDLPHLRNAISRLGQPKTDIPESEKKSLIKKARDILEKENKRRERKMADEDANDQNTDKDGQGEDGATNDDAQDNKDGQDQGTDQDKSGDSDKGSDDKSDDKKDDDSNESDKDKSDDASDGDKSGKDDDQKSDDKDDNNDDDKKDKDSKEDDKDGDDKKDDKKTSDDGDKSDDKKDDKKDEDKSTQIKAMEDKITSLTESLEKVSGLQTELTSLKSIVEKQAEELKKPRDEAIEAEDSLAKFPSNEPKVDSSKKSDFDIQAFEKQSKTM